MRILNLIRLPFNRMLLELTKDPLRDMFKSFKDTFKPFKTRYQILRDALSFFWGLGILLTAVGLAIAVIVSPIVALIKNLIKRDNFRENMKRSMQMTGLMFLAAITLAIRGATLMFCSPLVLLRMPLRAAIGKFKKPLTVEESAGIQRDIAVCEKAMKEYEDANKSVVFLSRDAADASREANVQKRTAASREMALSMLAMFAKLNYATLGKGGKSNVDMKKLGDAMDAANLEKNSNIDALAKIVVEPAPGKKLPTIDMAKLWNFKLDARVTPQVAGNFITLFKDAAVKSAAERNAPEAPRSRSKKGQA